MSLPAQILLLEDDINDAELIMRALRKGDIEASVVRVDTREAFIERLTGIPPPDVILSDYRVPDINGLEALELALKHLPFVPFVFVTGVLGEERAIETFRRGATDYILKNRLSLLGPAVQRALREIAEKKDRQRAEQRLRESREQLRALSIFLQQVREEERTRISREVHDELGQRLTGLKLDLAWLHSHLSEPRSAIEERIRGMKLDVNATIQTVRRIATALRPGILDNLGLVAALEWQASEFTNRTGIACIVTSDVDDSVLDADLNTAFFRIFQETLTNVMRHAEASRVSVHLDYMQGELILVIRDNGCGFAKDELKCVRSIGLVGMRERAALLGGRIEIDSEPGAGTTVSVIIPCAEPRLRRERENDTHESAYRRRPRRSATRSQAHTR